jgi:phage minor structural protein
MLISLHDNYQRRIAHIDNALPKAMHYNDDKWNRNLAYGTGLFDFTIDRQDLEIESQLVVGNYISFRYNNRDYMFTILRSEKSSDDKKIIVHSEYLSLGLLKSTQDPIDPPQSHTLEWYLTQSGILVNSGIKLGINEVPDLVRKIKIDGEQTSLQRLTSFATNFGAEIEYVTTLNRDGTLKSLVVNFYKKFDGVNQGVGTNRQDLTLSYGKNVSGIKQTTDITDFFSMITPTGKDGLTITSLDRTEYDDKGNVLFFTRPGQSSIYAPQSAQRFPSRLIRTNNDYTDHKYSADGTTDQNTLYTLALNELKKYCDPSIVYDVTGFYDLNIGDTVKIFDASFNPPLMLQARVAEQTISFSNPSNNKTVFGNIIALESQASQDLAGRLKELVDQVTPYRFEIVSDNGLTFKNNEGSTTLTARVFKGSNVDEVSVDSFEWLLDGVSFGGTAKSQLVNAGQVNGTAVVRYNAKIGDTVIGGLEVTLQDVSDGKPTGVTQSVTEPTETYEGMLWQYTGTNDLPVSGTTAVPQVTYVSKDDSWKVLDLPPENINTPTLSKLSDDWGDIKAGSFTNWQYSVGQASNTLNGVYIANGRVLNLSIENPKSQDPDFKGVAKGVAVRGTESYAGLEQHYMKLFPTDNNQSANEIIKDFDNFWITQNRAARLSSYIYTNGTKQLMITTDELLITGKATAAGQRGYAGNVMLSSDARAVSIVPNTPYTIGSLANYDAIKLYGQLFARRNFTLELDLTGPQLQYPDFAGYTRMVSATTGSRNEGADSREFMVYACINGALNTLLLKVFYRDGGNNWTENISTTNTIYKVVPIIY